MTSQAFQDLLDDAYLISLEYQLRLSDLIGEGTGIYDFTADLEAGKLTFIGPSSLHVGAHFLGSADPGVGTWLWGWDNVNDFPTSVVALARGIREYGERCGITELIESELPLAGDPEHEVSRYGAAASLICSMPLYTCRFGDATVALLLESERLALPPPTALRATTVVGMALTHGAIRDWQRALEFYAGHRGVDLTRANTRSIALHASDGTVEVTLDSHGRIGGLESQLLPSG